VKWSIAEPHSMKPAKKQIDTMMSRVDLGSINSSG
jgi:hypothetical protein